MNAWGGGGGGRRHKTLLCGYKYCVSLGDLWCYKYNHFLLSAENKKSGLICFGFAQAERLSGKSVTSASVSVWLSCYFLLCHHCVSLC